MIAKDLLFAHLVGDPRLRLWGLTPRERLRRQIEQLGKVEWIGKLQDLPPNAAVLIVDSGYVTELSTLKRLVGREDTVLRCPADGRFAAAHVSAENAEHALGMLLGDAGQAPQTLAVLNPAEIEVFDRRLRRSAPPFLEPVSADALGRLEDSLYGNAYKGITDLVTKWFWPKPAKHAVRAFANWGISPNAVTITGIALMVLSAALFLKAQFALGLVAGWIMTFLDTVDGKLARVTARSSRLGHVLDHGVDILHPPFWYVFWGMALADFQPVLGLDRVDFYWLIVIGYVAGRLFEALFHSLGDCTIFDWRPFDAYFRLFTARRNTCMILMTLSVVLGRPEWGFVSVAFWTVLTSAVMALRLAYGTIVRLKTGPLESWLADREVAARDHARAYATFSETRGAYASTS